MNSITSKAFQNMAFLCGISLLALVAVLFVPLHAAHAQLDDSDSGFSSGDCCDFSGGGGLDTSDSGFSSGDCCGYSTDYTQPTTDYSTGSDTSGGYTLPYSTGYSTGGYSTGGYSLPYSTGYSTGYATAPSNTNTNVNTNTNTCTTNSCNTTNNNNISNPAPIIYNPIIEQPSQPVYQPPVAPVCNTCGCEGYGNCYTPQYVPSTPICNCQAPMAYNYPPSISLSAVPYTGLDLTPTEQVLYWSFLILWCAVAAYLIAVKRIQVSIVRWLNATLFGGSTHTSVTKTVAKAHTTAPVAKSQVTSQSTDAIDPFILAQVNR